MGKLMKVEETEFQTFMFNDEDMGLDTVLIQDEPWFNANTLSKTLDYETNRAMTRPIDDEDKTTISMVVRERFENTTYKNQTLINESGLYNAIMRSRKAEAKRFQHWVTHEVLPSIRKYGNYSLISEVTPESSKAVTSLPDFSNPAEAARAWANEYEEKHKAMLVAEQSQKKIEEDAPKLAYYQSAMDSDGMMSLSQAIKTINIPGLGPKKGIQKLRDIGVLYTQGKYNSNIAYQQHIDAGYFKVVQIPTPAGPVVPSTRVTMKGCDYIYKRLTAPYNHRII